MTTANERKIIEPTKEAMDEYGHMYGSEVIALDKEMFKSLKEGKMLATNDGEYSHFIVLKKHCPPEYDY